MAITNTNLKALSECTSEQVHAQRCGVDALQTPELQATRVLLDECVTIRLDRARIHMGLKIDDSIEILGAGAKDHEIREYAKVTGYILVTRDFKNCCHCLEDNIKTAFYYKGKAYVLNVEKVIPLGEEKKTAGAPIKHYESEVVKSKRSFWALMARLLS